MGTAQGAGFVAVILNPAKVPEIENLKELFVTTAAGLGPLAVEFFETTELEPGGAQAARAVKAGASAVVAVGGDGTVRAVAAALAGSGVPLGIVPLGTGNLFARNMDLPLADLPEAVAIALSGQPDAIDVGWLRITRPGSSEPERTEHAFIVIAGMGLDAKMVEGARPEIKARIGWFAYFFSAIARLFDGHMTARVSLDHRHRTAPLKARTVMIANCGKLPGGMVLVPSARPDDGQLDVVVLHTRAGLIGWISLGVKVVLQRIGIRGRTDMVSAIESRPAKVVTIQSERPEGVEIDGESLGAATAIEGRVDEGALLVRVPIR